MPVINYKHINARILSGFVRPLRHRARVNRRSIRALISSLHLFGFVHFVGGKSLWCILSCLYGVLW